MSTHIIPPLFFFYDITLLLIIKENYAIIYFVSGDYMYIKMKNKKVKLVEANTFWERLKGLKFVLGPLEYGVRFPKKKSSNTNFLFERIDVILTDKDEKILYLIENLGTEKKVRRKKDVYNTYFVPRGTVKDLKVGDTLNLVVEKEDKLRREELEERKNKKKKETK